MIEYAIRAAYIQPGTIFILDAVPCRDRIGIIYGILVVTSGLIGKYVKYVTPIGGGGFFFNAKTRQIFVFTGKITLI